MGRSPEFVVTAPPGSPRRTSRTTPANCPRSSSTPRATRERCRGSTCACPTTSRPGSSRRPRARGSRSTPGAGGRGRAGPGRPLPPPERRPSTGGQRYGLGALTHERICRCQSSILPNRSPSPWSWAPATSRSWPADRADTVVEVRPSDPAKKADVTHAEQTRVEYAGGRLLIKARAGSASPPRGQRVGRRAGRAAGSSTCQGETGMAALHSRGRLGDCRYKTGLGDIQLDQAAAVQLRTGMGDVAVERAGGDTEVATGSGSSGSSAPTARRWSRTPTATSGSVRSRATCG